MSIFTFKQFIINQSASAMKVGTDSVLLGCLAKADNPKRILDIGTGTGLLALMMAQRFEQAHIDAVEIDEAAANEATQNINQNKWANRMCVVNQPIQHFIRNELPLYDVIISNPPYYKHQHNIPITQQGRQTSRQDVSLSFTEFLNVVNKLLSATGSAWVILPKKEGDLFIQLFSLVGFMQHTQIDIKPNIKKETNRIIIGFGKKQSTLLLSEFIIYDNHQVYSDEYKNLVFPFLL